MTSIIDTHAHYDDDKFSEDRSEFLSSLVSKGVSKVINCATDLKTSLFTVDLCNSYDYIYGALGIHPEEIETASATDIDEVKKLILTNKKIVAVGEIGLDYYWDTSFKEKQLEFFISQIKLAKELDLPVIIHDREAHGDTLEIVKEHKPKGVLHCFSGSVEMAKEVLKCGMYLGFGGSLTFKNARKAVEVAQMVPLDRFLFETDCPYLAPVPHRGKRNDSSLISFVAQRMAEIKGTDTDEILKIANDNAVRLFEF